MLEQLFADKTLKPKERTEQLSKLVAGHTISVADLIKYADKAKDPIKATCIESLEFASKTDPAILKENELEWVISCLTAKAPRIKWESAKVTGNVIHLFPKQIPFAVNKLLDNTENEGTVVRWSAAFAISQILKMKSSMNDELIAAVETIITNEEKNSIKKIYLDALKKIRAK